MFIWIIVLKSYLEHSWAAYQHILALTGTRNINVIFCLIHLLETFHWKSTSDVKSHCFWRTNLHQKNVYWRFHFVKMVVERTLVFQRAGVIARLQTTTNTSLFTYIIFGRSFIDVSTKSLAVGVECSFLHAIHWINGTTLVDAIAISTVALVH